MEVKVERSMSAGVQAPGRVTELLVFLCLVNSSMAIVLLRLLMRAKWAPGSLGALQ